MEITGKYFNNIYKKLVKHILEKGTNITVRGKKTLECTNCIITLRNIDNDHIAFNTTQAHERQDKYNHYRKREIEWYESGCLLAEHAPSELWKQISNKEGKIQSNYGYLILHERRSYSSKGITSYKNVLNILCKDKYSRQAIFHYNLPSHYSSNMKDIPCTVSTQALIRNKKMNFIVFQRSADLFFGIPYDVPWHCHLLKKLVNDFNKSNNKINPGNLTIVIGSAHIYSKDIPFMKKLLIKRKAGLAQKK